MQPLVAIVGRPNVGKSTLFNRLVGKRLALVDDRPGVTRDRRTGDARLGDLNFTVIDTAGFDEGEAQSLAGRMQVQTEAAIREADAVLFLMDARAGILPDDRAFADIVRRSGKPVVLIANKAEGKAMAGAYEAFELGLGEPVAISAEHGEGLADLHEAWRAAEPAQHQQKARRHQTETNHDRKKIGTISAPRPYRQREGHRQVSY
jgi:GTPase